MYSDSIRLTFNALGQYGAVVFGNGASAVYQYYQSNNRLYSVTAGGPAQGLMNLTYSYDSAGNITGITDLIDGARSQTFTYDHVVAKRSHAAERGDAQGLVARDFSERRFTVFHA